MNPWVVIIGAAVSWSYIDLKSDSEFNSVVCPIIFAVFVIIGIVKFLRFCRCPDGHRGGGHRGGGHRGGGSSGGSSSNGSFFDGGGFGGGGGDCGGGGGGGGGCGGGD